jgi:pantoate--beta-alanine ligase
LPTEIVNWVTEQINKVPGLDVEYYEIVDVKSLQTVNSWEKPTVGCIAVFCGEVRLIDNIRYNY